MILALCLLTWGVALLTLAPRALSRWAAGERALTGLLAWQLISWLAVASFAVAASLLAFPPLAAAGRLPNSVEACLAVVRGVGNPADSQLLQGVAVGVLAVLVLRVLACSLRSTVTNYRYRTRHRALLSLVGWRDPFLGAHIVADPTAVVYCLPGRGGRIVFTSSAVERLTVSQRAAVLAHEHAHLRGRHHLLIGSASLLSRSFPRVRLFSVGLASTLRLVEMRADDLASRGCGRRPVAEALLALADMNSSATVLAATGATTAARVERLLSHQVPARTSPSRCLRRASVIALAFAAVAGSPVAMSGLGHGLLCLI